MADQAHCSYRFYLSNLVFTVSNLFYSSLNPAHGQSFSLKAPLEALSAVTLKVSSPDTASRVTLSSLGPSFRLADLSYRRLVGIRSYARGTQNRPAACI